MLFLPHLGTWEYQDVLISPTTDGRHRVYIKPNIDLKTYMEHSRPLTKNRDYFIDGHTLVLDSMYAPLPFTFRTIDDKKLTYSCESQRQYHTGHCKRHYYRSRSFCLMPYQFPVIFCPDMYVGDIAELHLDSSIVLEKELIHRRNDDKIIAWLSGAIDTAGSKLLSWFGSVCSAAVKFVLIHLESLSSNDGKILRWYMYLDDTFKNITVIVLLVIISACLVGIRRTYSAYPPIKLWHDLLALADDSYIYEVIDGEKRSYYEIVEETRRHRDEKAAKL